MILQIPEDQLLSLSKSLEVLRSKVKKMILTFFLGVFSSDILLFFLVGMFSVKGCKMNGFGGAFFFFLGGGGVGVFGVFVCCPPFLGAF